MLRFLMHLEGTEGISEASFFPRKQDRQHLMRWWVLSLAKSGCTPSSSVLYALTGCVSAGFQAGCFLLAKWMFCLSYGSLPACPSPQLIFRSVCSSLIFPPSFHASPHPPQRSSRWPLPQLIPTTIRLGWETFPKSPNTSHGCVQFRTLISQVLV